jgi:hypothetical protein
MDHESIPRQITSGAAFGVVLGAAAMLRGGRPLLDTHGLGMLAAWAVGGAVLHAALSLICPNERD